MSSKSAKAWNLRNPEKAKQNVRSWAKRNPKKVNDYQSKWRAANPEKRMLIAAKGRAKRDGVDFNITTEDIIIPKYCPLLGVELTNGHGKGGWKINSASLDRIDSTKGYIKGNVWVISFRANAIKHNATIEELERIILALKIQRGDYAA